MDSCWHLGDDMRAQSQKGAAVKEVKDSSGFRAESRISRTLRSTVVLNPAG